MKFKGYTVGGPVEILATDDDQAIPFVVHGEEPVLAGMPMKLDGTKATNGTDADGILLYDVNPAENPNAALVVDGMVDWEKCKTHSGATADAEAMKAALPNIIFRKNIGVTAADTE